MNKIKALLIFIMLPAILYSQEDNIDKILDEFLFGENASDSLLNSIIANESDINFLLDDYLDFSYIYLRSEVESKTYFSGREFGSDKMNILTQVFYQGSKGLNIGAAGVVYTGFQPKYNTTIISAGYNNRIKGAEALSLRAVYSRYFFAKVDTIDEYAFNSSVNGGLTLQGKYGGLSTDLAVLIGSDPSFQLSGDLFGDFTLFRFGKYNKALFSPEISFYLGNETIIVSQFIRRFWGIDEILTEQTTFGLMNTVMRLPVQLMLGDFDIKAGYNFNFPRVPGSDLKPEKTSYFNISIGYMFGL
jgi:hypothetical protein